MISVAAGDFHSMILKQDGSVWSCGLNTDGQLGIPFVTYASATFKQTTIASGAIAIAAGVVHSLALKQDGSLWMSGKQDGDEQPKRQRFLFLRVIDGAKAVAAGNGHSMVLTQDGVVLAMGQNQYGQLGDGSYADKTRFVKVMKRGASAIAAGHLHSMILKADGGVWSTGWNGDGQIGIGSKSDKVWGKLNFFSQVMSDGKAVAAGGYHSIILRVDGTVWTTGWNMYGQLGDGTTIDRNFYHVVSSNAKAIAAGTRHSIVLKMDGSVWTTLFDIDTQPDDFLEEERGIFIQVISDGAEAVAASNYHTLVLKEDDSVWAAGSNKYGQLGYLGAYKNSIRNFVQAKTGDGS